MTLPLSSRKQWCSAFGASRMLSGTREKRSFPSVNGSCFCSSGGSSSFHSLTIFVQSNGPSTRFPFTITGKSWWTRYCVSRNVLSGIVGADG